MRLYFFLFFASTIFTPFLQAQMPMVEVADLTLKIPPKSEEVLYYGFAKGDQIHFTFWEEEGKELTQVEIEEFPGQIRFADVKTAKLENKTITANRKAVYKFRFVNGQVLKGRVCHIKINRIPASDEMIEFNTQVRWITSYDTTYTVTPQNVLLGYDTLYNKEESWEFKKSAQEEVVVFDKQQRVFAKTSWSNGNRVCFKADLPENLYSKAKTRELVGWAYWIGVGEEAANIWNENIQTVGKFAQGVIGMYSPLGGLITGLVTNLAIPNTGEDIYYCLTDATGADLFMKKQKITPLDWGKGKGGYGKFNKAPAKTCYICLENDNYLQAVDVSIKVIAMVEVKQYIAKEKNKQSVQPRMQKEHVEEPIITPKQIPVTTE
ncbi:MAG TPA: hypothetical protein PK239_03660 [Chitinophagales bacterium]|nr:hypothetical protein [Chitinophagales bacterium]